MSAMASPGQATASSSTVVDLAVATRTTLAVRLATMSMSLTQLAVMVLSFVDKMALLSVGLGSD